MAAFITNFQSPKELADLMDRYEHTGVTNLDLVLNLSEYSEFHWTVKKDAVPGDIVLFMCAKTSADHSRRVYREAVEFGDEELIDFAQEKKDLYRAHAGKILALGILEEAPYMSDAGYAFPGWRSPWYGNVQQRILLDHPISIDAFRDFIYISRTGAITELSEDQWMELRRRIEKINPGLDLSIEIKRTWSKVGKEGMKE